MSERKQIYNVMVPEEYVGADRVARTSYFQVGVAFPTKSGEGLSVKLAPNVSLSGGFLILPRQQRDTGSSAAPDAAADFSTGAGEEIPF
ncbi:hypothetical protein [Chelatococcus asaccharovorans]|uniref:Uncharacterized protein n=1 Tax=Chelatococcus asaccharovorans TaxID=28210 RepID=A0A2V3TRP9_9HYPH|nr:hypothetical protein [Chelatococcus asaccharovorans]MBS7708169.1 hypothetical protein [Chelatococcus asaccharovorans]PXW50109.1 hypothetical protein C7450_1325 [Chelatococcus asaccharovorans]